MRKAKLTLYIFLLFCIPALWAQSLSSDQFTFQKKIEAGPVLNQYRSNTCWSYTLLGMLEAEIMDRMGKDISLSEMYLVYYAYLEKAERYLRMHGKIAFSEGGMLTDPLNLIEKYGIVPREVYSGLLPGETLPDHQQLESNLKSYLDELLLKKTLPEGWKKRFQEMLELYMGEVPGQFEYQGQVFTPKGFAQMLGIRANDYVLLMSFEYLPYYRASFVEVPDNWSLTFALNVPIDELMALIDNSIQNGFPVAITCDITEKGFMWSKGIAFAFSPETNDVAVKDALSQNQLPDFTEVKADARLRQKAFDTFETTDDHSLVLVGIAYDKSGRKYYYAKNSWGVFNTPYQGYMFVSKDYLQYKIITLLIRKQVLPSALLQKLG
ncbi:MAG: C1 family peptidase [Bacteroidales bacterium]